MALSNYLLATLLIVAVAPSLPIADQPSYDLVVLLSLTIGVVQGVVPRFVMHRAAYGPVEWLWRSLTWLRPVRFRRREG